MRVTLDWDDISEKELVRRLRLIRAIYPGHRKEVWASSSGEGYHVIVYGACDSFEDNLAIRGWLKDDHFRIVMDSIRRKQNAGIQLLYNLKGKYNMYAVNITDRYKEVIYESGRCEEDHRAFMP